MDALHKLGASHFLRERGADGKVFGEVGKAGAAREFIHIVARRGRALTRCAKLRAQPR